MEENERYEMIKGSPVLIIDGKVYRLVYVLNPTSNDVCSKCELKSVCCRVDSDYPICGTFYQGEKQKLCFFKSTQTIDNWKIVDVCLEQAKELGLDR